MTDTNQIPEKIWPDDEQPECYVCGLSHSSQDYGKLEQRDFRYPGSPYREFFHDQCWTEFNVLNAWKEAARKKTA